MIASSATFAGGNAERLIQRHSQPRVSGQILTFHRPRTDDRIASDSPATGPFHWDNRYLSVRELAAIQTFPSDYTVLGTRVEAHRQIGNAVPSALAELIALEIRARFFGEPHLETATPTLLPTKSASAPKARAAALVPEKYLEYIGEHQAHPGTGKGYGTQRTRSSARDFDGLPHLQRR